MSKTEQDAWVAFWEKRERKSPLPFDLFDAGFRAGIEAAQRIARDEESESTVARIEEELK